MYMFLPMKSYKMPPFISNRGDRTTTKKPWNNLLFTLTICKPVFPQPKCHFPLPFLATRYIVTLYVVPSSFFLLLYPNFKIYANIVRRITFYSEINNCISFVFHDCTFFQTSYVRHMTFWLKIYSLLFSSLSFLVLFSHLLCI